MKGGEECSNIEGGGGGVKRVGLVVTSSSSSSSLDSSLTEMSAKEMNAKEMSAKESEAAAALAAAAATAATESWQGNGKKCNSDSTTAAQVVQARLGSDSKSPSSQTHTAIKPAAAPACSTPKRQRPRSNSMPSSPNRSLFRSQPALSHYPQQRAPPLKTQSPTLSPSLRRGKWTVEEEAYVARVIRDFNYGYLNAPAGTTLRTYLSEKLHCDPMRITKKFTGDSCIGKRIFHPAVRSYANAEAIDRAQAELEALEKRWRRRLELQQREASRKAAAASSLSNPLLPKYQQPLSSPTLPPTLPTTTSPAAAPPQLEEQRSLVDHHNVVVQRTATWLDRAQNVLSSNNSCVHSQINEVRKLIHEAPIIQQTYAGTARVLDPSATSGENKSTPVTTTNQQMHASASETDLSATTGKRTACDQIDNALPTALNSTLYPTTTFHNVSDIASTNNYKKVRKSFSTNYLPTLLHKQPMTAASAPTTTRDSASATGAEDAEALVGFLNSVRRQCATTAANSTQP